MRHILASVLALLVLGLGGCDYLGVTDIPDSVLREKYLKADDRFVQVGEGKVHYRDEGKGKVIILIHGFGASLDTWDGWAKELSKQYRVIRFDLPPFGFTGPVQKAPMNAVEYVKFLESFTKALGLERFVLAGNSLGGYVSWNYAVAHPEQVEQLVLVDAAGYPHKVPVAIKLMQMPVIGPMTDHLSPKFMVSKSLKEVYGDPSLLSDDKIQRYHDMIRHEGNRPAIRALAGELAKRNADAVKKVSCPTLILWGKKDTWIPPEHAELFHRDIKGSRLVWFDGQGHVPMEEAPELTLKPVLDFLAGQNESGVLK